MIDVQKVIELRVETLEKELACHKDWADDARKRYEKEQDLNFRTADIGELRNAHNICEKTEAVINELKWCLTLFTKQEGGAKTLSKPDVISAVCFCAEEIEIATRVKCRTHGQYEIVEKQTDL